MNVLIDHSDFFLRATGNTLILFFAGGLIALVLGTIVGMMRVSPVPIMRATGTFYVTMIRNTPLTLVFFFFALGVPQLLPGRSSYMALAIAALGIYTATYVAEVLRSGFNTVPFGQAEAARALGLTFTQVMKFVVVPQAFRSVVPPMMSVFIALLKNTTVAAGFSVMELGSTRANMSEQGENLMTSLLLVAAIFVALVAVLSWAQRYLENRWRVAR